jgi:hypothetical protein
VPKTRNRQTEILYYGTQNIRQLNLLRCRWRGSDCHDKHDVDEHKSLSNIFMANFGRVSIIYLKSNQLFGKGTMSVCQQYVVLPCCYSTVLLSNVWRSTVSEYGTQTYTHAREDSRIPVYGIWGNLKFCKTIRNLRNLYSFCSQ